MTVCDRERGVKSLRCATAMRSVLTTSQSDFPQGSIFGLTQLRVCILDMQLHSVAEVQRIKISNSSSFQALRWTETGGTKNMTVMNARAEN